MSASLALRQGTVFVDPVGFHNNSGVPYGRGEAWKVDGSRPDGWLLCTNVRTGQRAQFPLRESWFAGRTQQIYIGAGPEIQYTPPEPAWKEQTRRRLREILNAQSIHQVK